MPDTNKKSAEVQYSWSQGLLLWSSLLK